MQRIRDARVLSFEGCPGAKPTRDALVEALAGVSPGTVVETVEVSPEEAQGSGPSGSPLRSPTILVNGRDLFLEEGAGGAQRVSCRVYATPEGIKNHPTAGMVRAALEGALGGAFLD